MRKLQQLAVSIKEQINEKEKNLQFIAKFCKLSYELSKTMSSRELAIKFPEYTDVHFRYGKRTYELAGSKERIIEVGKSRNIYSLQNLYKFFKADEEDYVKKSNNTITHHFRKHWDNFKRYVALYNEDRFKYKNHAAFLKNAKILLDKTFPIKKADTLDGYIAAQPCVICNDLSEQMYTVYQSSPPFVGYRICHEHRGEQPTDEQLLRQVNAVLKHMAEIHQDLFIR